MPLPLPRLLPVPAADPPGEEDPGPAPPPPVTGALAPAYDPRTEPLVWGPRGALPDERRLRSLGQAVAEVLAGRRPAAALSGRFTARCHAELVRAGTMIEARRPLLVGRPHVTEPREGVVEMCLLVHCGERSRALALRLERHGVQWLVTDFETA